MKKAQKLIGLALTLAMILALLCGCGASGSQPASSNQPASATESKQEKEENTEAKDDGAVYTVTLGSVWSLDHPVTKLLDEFYIPYVAEKTNNHVIINHHPNSELGSEGDLSQSVMTGTIQMGALGDLIGLNQVKQVEVLELPYMWESEDQFWAAQTDEYLAMINEELKSYNLDLLCLHKRGFRQMVTDIPVNSMADLKGLVFRAPGVDMMIEGLESYGLIPSVIAWSDVYSASQQGVVHGSEGSLDSLWAMKLFEVTPYLAMTNHQVSMGMFVVNHDWFSSLPEEYQEVLKEGAVELAVKIRNEITKNEEEWMKDFTVTYPDREDFRKAALPVAKKYVEEHEWAADVLKMVGKVDLLEEIGYNG